MNKTTFMAAIVALSLLIPFSAETGAVNAQSSQAVTIEADGSVNPPSATLQKDGYIYTLTADFNGSITIERGSIVLDGAGHTLQGPGTNINFFGINIIASNVTITNTHITNWKTGILGTYNNNTITRCDITKNQEGITIYANDYIVSNNKMVTNQFAFHIKGGATRPQGDNNLILQNQLSGNNVAFDIAQDVSNGITIKENDIANSYIIALQLSVPSWPLPNDYAEHTIVFYNNFTSNKEIVGIYQIKQGLGSMSVAGKWDNGTVGNYWSNYIGVDADHDGVGDTPNTINVIGSGTATAVDNYPLTSPINDTFSVGPSPSSYPTPTPTPSPILTPTSTAESSPTQQPTLEPTQSPTPSPEPNSSGIEQYFILIPVLIAVIAVIAALVYVKKNKRNSDTP